MPSPSLPRVGGSFSLEQLEKIAYLESGETMPSELAGVELPPGFEPHGQLDGGETQGGQEQSGGSGDE